MDLKKKVLITAGPIPARLDSVKYITNRFKGGLTLKLADEISKTSNVTIVAWKYSGIKSDLPMLFVEDVEDYYNTVLNFEADVYILAAAVANLGPLNPIVGKFPSHKYKEGDIFSIDFTIMPRVIDAIKNKYPRSTLIAYKLFDGTNDELISAARHTLDDSRANIVFANHPSWAKDKKIVITADGAAFEVSFSEHIYLIKQLLNNKFYSTTIVDNSWDINKYDQFIIKNYPKTHIDGKTFGTFAIRDSENRGFITTTRGKKNGEEEISFVSTVDNENLIVYANKKATLNVPLLNSLLENNPQINYLIHDHLDIGVKIQNDYQFPGTTGDLLNSFSTKDSEFILNLPHHGYIAGFYGFEDCVEFMKKYGSK